MTKSQLVWGIVGVIILGGLVSIAVHKKAVAPEQTADISNTTSTSSADTSGVSVSVSSTGGTISVTPLPLPKIVTVRYTDSGFSPDTVSIKKGDSVKWVNATANGDMWVASAIHPTHAVYGGHTLQQHCPDTDNNDFDECHGDQVGISWTFTFEKMGTWKYHDHLHSSFTGTVVVQ